MQTTGRETNNLSIHVLCVMHLVSQWIWTFVFHWHLQTHFEECQFEQHRLDGKKKLKWDSIPTQFKVPNPPKPLALKRPANRLVVEKGKAAAAALAIPTQSTTDHDHPCKKSKIEKENIAPPSSTPASADHIYAKGTALKSTAMPIVEQLERLSDVHQQLQIRNSCRRPRCVVDVVGEQWAEHGRRIL